MRVVENGRESGVAAATDGHLDFELELELDGHDTQSLVLAMGTQEIEPVDAELIETSACVLTSDEGGVAAVRIEDVAAITHDLRSPLSTIALEVAVIQESLPERSSSEVRRSLTRIERNIEFIDRMIHDLLDLASIDSRRFQLRRAPVDLGAMILDLVERIVATRDRERLYLDLPDAAHALVVYADGPRIERVICNFIQNALKYAPRGSPLLVRLDHTPKYARVSVVDRGPGLSVEEARYVFDKCRRAPSASRCEGSGLGLYVSRKLIEAHDGRIGVSSAVGEGSSFYFDLPLTVPR